MSETIEPRAAPPPSPHPRAVWRMLKQAYRNYVASGSAAGITITTIPGFAHTAILNVQGTVQVNPPVPLPATLAVVIKQGAATIFTPAAAPVNQTNGNWATTVPANTLAAGTYTAVATSTNPAATATSNSFVVT